MSWGVDSGVAAIETMKRERHKGDNIALWKRELFGVEWWLVTVHRDLSAERCQETKAGTSAKRKTSLDYCQFWKAWHHRGFCGVHHVCTRANGHSCGTRMKEGNLAIVAPSEWMMDR